VVSMAGQRLDPSERDRVARDLQAAQERESGGPAPVKIEREEAAR